MKVETTIKTVKRGPKYITINKAGIEDPKLSWEAIGLLVYLMGRTDDYKIDIKGLRYIKNNTGEDDIMTFLNELRRHNYCHLFRIIKDGKIMEEILLVFEIPIEPSEALRKYIVGEEGEEINYVSLENDGLLGKLE